ncbi:MAG: hypothetical protein JSU00_21165 [Acidobacteria bacterium]|nr:hypothetical protein [Acidobacteriota bacterium]
MPDSPEGKRRPLSPLHWIKLAHTVVRAFFAGCIVAIPAATAMGRLGWAMALSAAVLVECGILACNRGRCPLTDVAGRYTKERQDNFDIYLPLRLARYNKVIFGALFAASLIYLAGAWITRPGGR